LTFFTNYRAIQIYCCHDPDEERAVQRLSATNFKYLKPFEDLEIDGKTYHQATDILFEELQKYVAWESVSVFWAVLRTFADIGTGTYIQRVSIWRRYPPAMPMPTLGSSRH
jgi:hypothetical protein